jgi:Nif-specific regulatory protein
MHARLSLEAGEGQPTSCDFSGDRVITLGRNRSNTIVLADKHASRWHAELVYEAGHWLLRDCGTLNGTRRNGDRLQRPTLLMHGDEIGIGDTRLRFLIADEPDSDAIPTPAEVVLPPLPLFAQPPADLSGQTALLVKDELTALCQFVNDALGETAPRALVTRALTTLLNQTGATTAGYLSFDQDDPLPKLVLPQQAHVDAHLSRQLTQQMVQSRKLVWLGATDTETPDSLCAIGDAVCLPLTGPAPDRTPLGALHVYRTSRCFADREVRFCEVLAGFLGSCLQALRSRRNLEAENSRLRIHGAGGDDELIGDSQGMEKLRQTVARVASGPVNVLVVGESGVGKELVALALHRMSPRRHGPLVAVNCAAIPQSLMESELFGHVKGAFSGAHANRPGLFEQADEGTLFLDEIGELSAECQAKMLRVLEGKGFRQVGGTSDLNVDVRIIAATNRNLEREVEEGRFREDLFYRLRLPIRVPALRDHSEDIPSLVQYFLTRLTVEYHRTIRLTPAALKRLREHSWPGNVRQLRTVLEHIVAMGNDGDEIDANDLPLGIERKKSVEELRTLNLEDLESDAVRLAMRQTDGNKVQAAKLLGIHRDTLVQKLRKYGIEKEGF